jgi:serine protease Do
VKRALILATVAVFLLVSVGAHSSFAPVPGWLGLGYTYHVTNTSTGRMVWLFVRQIAPGSPADRAGLKTQDVITLINGKRISFIDELAALKFFSEIRPGQRVMLGVARGRTVQTVTIVAGDAPPYMGERRRINEELAKAQRR